MPRNGQVLDSFFIMQLEACSGIIGLHMSNELLPDINLETYQWPNDTDQIPVEIYCKASTSQKSSVEDW